MASALLELNELVKLAVAVLPLAAAALPYPLISWSAVTLVDVLVTVLVTVLESVLELPFAWTAVEFSFAAAPLPLCVEVAVAVCEFLLPSSLLFVGFAK